jgi:hypothetical protein
MNQHPDVQDVLRFFEFEHLRAGELRDTSRRFYVLAHELADRLPADTETVVALRKLLESKDAAVRASLALVTDPARREALDRKPVEPPPLDVVDE